MGSASEKYRGRNRSDESRDGHAAAIAERGGGEDGGVRLFPAATVGKERGLRAEGGIDKIGRTLGFLHPFCYSLFKAPVA